MTTRNIPLALETGSSTDRDSITDPLTESGVRAERVESTAPTLLAASAPRTAPDAASVSAPPSAVLATGDLLDGVYRVEKQIGRGAMGAVYLVEHIGLGRKFAAKVVAAHHAANPDLVQRLRNEARIASQVQHENIVDVTHLGNTADGSIFIVMELLEGGDLRDWMLKRSDAPIPFGDIRRIAADVMAGLAAAHDAGIVHRDLKPENVFLVERQGRTLAKLVDFGISKSSHSHEDLRLTRTGQIMGTPLYMAPEQTRSTSDVDARADQYSLGVMLYELVTGRLPFAAENLWDMIVKHATVPPDPLRTARSDTPAAVEAVVFRCLAKRPDERFESIHALRAAWDAAWDESAHVADAASPEPRVSEGAAPEPAELESPLTSRSQPTASASGASSSQLPAVMPTARRSLAFPIGVALTLLVVAPFAYLAVHREPPSAPVRGIVLHPEPRVVRTQPTVQGRPPATATPPVATPTQVHRTLHTQPERAAVRIGDIDVGATPYDLAVTSGSPITVEFRLPGYRHESRTVSADDPEPLPITLRRTEQERRPALAPR